MGYSLKQLEKALGEKNEELFILFDTRYFYEFV